MFGIKINKKDFHTYINQAYFNGIGYGKHLSDEYITFITFEKWKVFYEADPDNWAFYQDNYYHNDKDVIFPFYTYIENSGNEYRVIKFPTIREYRKFFRFYKKNIKNNVDCFENQKEILELAQIIEEKSKERVAKEQRKLQETYQKTLRLASGQKEQDPIQKYFSNETSKTKFGSGKKVPYRAILDKSVDAYAITHVDFIDRFVKIQGGIFSAAEVYRIPKGSHVVYQEKFVDGYTFCRLSQKLNIWIRICDIARTEEINAVG